MASTARINSGTGACCLRHGGKRAGAPRRSSEVLGYHCWIESLYPVAGGESRLEIIDFTIRHDAAAASASRVPFTRPDDKLFLWDWSDVMEPPPEELCRKMGAGKRAAGWLWKDAASTRLVRKYELVSMSWNMRPCLNDWLCWPLFSCAISSRARGAVPRPWRARRGDANDRPPHNGCLPFDVRGCNV